MHASSSQFIHLFSFGSLQFRQSFHPVAGLTVLTHSSMALREAVATHFYSERVTCCVMTVPWLGVGGQQQAGPWRRPTRGWLTRRSLGGGLMTHLPHVNAMAASGVTPRHHVAT